MVSSIRQPSGPLHAGEKSTNKESIKTEMDEFSKHLWQIGG